MLAEMSSVVKVVCFMFRNNFRTTTASGYNESEVDLANHQCRLVRSRVRGHLGMFETQSNSVKEGTDILAKEAPDPNNEEL